MRELAEKIDKNYEKANNYIPWRQIYGLRNKIVYDYEGVNFTLVWTIIDEDLKESKIKLEWLVNSLGYFDDIMK